jgi:hypothetical protein
VDVGEDEVVIVQNANGPLGGKVRGAVVAEGGDESQPLLLDQFLHLVR